MKYAYEVLLSFYPPSYLVRFGREMLDVFEQAMQDYRSRGLIALWTFLCMEFGGLMIGAIAEWSGENSRRARAGRTWTLPFVLSIAAGLALTWFFQGNVYKGLSKQRPRLIAPHIDPSQTTPQLIALLAMIGIVILFVSLVSLAFVWNMRTIGNREGRLKPIWMPGRAVDARTTRRNQALHRNSRRQQRELHRRSR